MEQDITCMLREKGFKATPQRLAIYEALLKSKKHPTAEMLFTDLQPQYPTMSLATVYKTVDVLARLDVIRVLNINEDAFRYDAEIKDHVHIKCTVCNTVEDIPHIELDKLLEEAQHKSGYKIASNQIHFFGVCPNCSSAVKN